MTQFQTLMPIRTKGSGLPLFCVHGQPLRVAQRLQSDRPVYGLSHVYHADFHERSPESIEELAATYLAEVRQVQPTGPYHFCGFSAGGLIAYEMAQQLLDAGETIGSLTLVEPSVAKHYRGWSARIVDAQGKPESTQQFIQRKIARLPRSIKMRTENMFRTLITQIFYMLNKPLPENLRWLGYLKSLGPAIKSYIYQPINCKGTLLYGRMNAETRKNCNDFWSGLFLEGAKVEVFDNIVKHNEFMVDPGLRQTVALIEQEQSQGLAGY